MIPHAADHIAEGPKTGLPVAGPNASHGGIVAKVRDIMNSPAWCVRADDDLAHARHEMVRRGVKNLPVVDPDSGEPLGVLTVTDVLKAEYSANGEARRRNADGLVRDAMTKNVYTTDPERGTDTLAYEMARRGHGAIPVVEDGRVVGIVTPTDLLAHAPDRFEGRLQVREIMRRDAPRFHRHDTAAKIAKRLLEDDFRAAIVTESESSGAMVGLVTRESLVFGAAFEPYAPKGERTSYTDDEKRVQETRRRERASRADARHVDTVDAVAEDLMIEDVATLSPGADARAAANHLVHEGLPALPVVEGSDVLGLVSKRDLVTAYQRLVR